MNRLCFPPYRRATWSTPRCPSACSPSSVHRCICDGFGATKKRRRTYLYMEIVLAPIVLLVALFISVPFIGIALGAVGFIWVKTAIASPWLVGVQRNASTPSYPKSPVLHVRP